MDNRVPLSFASQQLKIPHPTVSRWVKKGFLPGERLYGIVWVSLDEVRKIAEWKKSIRSTEN